MIEVTFAHVRDVYRKGEIRLWRSNISTWTDLLNQPKKHPHFTKRMWKELRESCIQCNQALKTENYEFFLRIIPQQYIWRFFTNLREKILYFDVEMTGLDLQNDQITTIAASNGKEIFTFVRGENLHEFPKLLDKYPAICTFDGDKVDLPFVSKEFNYEFSHIHFDLFQISRILSISGGLKQIEKRLNIERNISDGLDGRAAIFFWNKYLETNKKDYLNALLAYNIEDVINLQFILPIFYEMLRQKQTLPEQKLDPIQNSDSNFTQDILKKQIPIEIITEVTRWLEKQQIY